MENDRESLEKELADVEEDADIFHSKEIKKFHDIL